ncbi:hypothetical protein CF319_g5007 [Tilletia indica]|uniref:t-SNARE coiled-coil homology domain-containing protein n=1 Tax=Tilletia indica TaxID=43049 RepID=A0A177TI78_9BASI|nr:hypothetical protein CF319_g5007 [Tilletia indica]KAE8234120.1 hypothetical protein CF326_g839 [Tilletia indica]KAE8257289.1 hypothetical protein A4X13_0g2454 [Tilletia indica]
MAAVHSTASLGSLHSALRPFVRGSASASSSKHTLPLPDLEQEEDDLDFEFEYATEEVEQEYARAPVTPGQEDQASPSSIQEKQDSQHHAYPPSGGIDSATPAPPLAQDQPLHDALSSELLRLSTVLKSNAVAFGATLERDRLLLAKSSDQLGANLDFMTRTRGRLGEYSRRAKGMGWFTLGSIGIVMASWVLCFILIRLT